MLVLETARLPDGPALAASKMGMGARLQVAMAPRRPRRLMLLYSNKN